LRTKEVTGNNISKASWVHTMEAQTKTISNLHITNLTVTNSVTHRIVHIVFCYVTHASSRNKLLTCW
jgi:hypothetical protein